MTDLELAELRGTLIALATFPTTSHLDKKIQTDLLPGILTIIDELLKARTRIAELERQLLNNGGNNEQTKRLRARIKTLEHLLKLDNYY